MEPLVSPIQIWCMEIIGPTWLNLWGYVQFLKEPDAAEVVADMAFTAKLGLLFTYS